MKDTKEQSQDQEQHSSEARCSIMFLVTDKGELMYDGFCNNSETSISDLALLYCKLRQTNAIELLFGKLINEMDENQALLFAESVELFTGENEPLIQPFENHQAFKREDDEEN